ncbi:MAG: chromosome segregation protein SMC [Myxococcota bacterium]|nr:chromosome segregation protein SMC [Myxococcota bacterium]
MRIKSLQISGFKSFVDRSVLAFQPGITAIVGPNGCGKSNVVDAMRWAMGEQSPRHLRGKSMDDVIFAGSELRPAVGMAEVVLTFDNSDGRAPAEYAGFTEIQISRRLYRDGNSEYLINKTSCRLRDVLDFFRDTGIGTRGYTIVEQGQIAGIVSAKPEDRRAMLEEAAGIGKYKARRQEAERKLSATEQNLVRVHDVLGELKRQIATLERQAKKAARFKRLQERLRLLELSIASEDRRGLEENAASQRRRLIEQRDELGAAETRLAEREADLERVRLDLAERERAVVAGSELLFGLRSEIKQLESRIEYEDRERATLAETRAAREEEMARLREQVAAARAEERSAGDELAQLEAQVESERSALSALEAQVAEAVSALRRLEGEREAANPRLVDALTGIARAEDRGAAAEQRRAEIARRLRSTDELIEVQQGEASRADAEQRRLEEGLNNLLAERDRLMSALREAIDQNERATARAKGLTTQVREAREHHGLRAARAESLREVLERAEDVGEGTRHLLEESENLRSAHGLRAMVRDVLEADADVERAVEAVLQERAEALVATGLEGALSAIDRLRSSDAGRAVLVIERPDEPLRSGFVPLGEPLLSRVRVKPGFEGVARALLGDVNLVPDLGEVAKVYAGAHVPATFVTPAGDVLGTDGVLRGGSGGGTGLLARARELREIEQEVHALGQQLALLAAEQLAAETEAARVADELDNLRNRHHTAALAVASHEKDLERARERVKTTFEAHEGRVAERSELVAESEALEAESRALGLRLEELRVARANCQRDLDALSLQIGEASRGLARFEAALTERRVAHAARAEKRDRLAGVCARAAAAAAESQQWIERREREIEEIEARRAQLAESSAGAREALHAKLGDEERARQDADRARDAYERAAADVRDREDEGRTLRADCMARRERIQTAELEIRDAEQRLTQLDDRVLERWKVELATWTPPVAGDVVPVTSAFPAEEGEETPDAEDAESIVLRSSDTEWLERPRDEREKHAAELRKRVEHFGDVHMGAIEEHEEINERMRFLDEQKNDLETTVASLREAIARINRSSRKRFRETFDAVNERFQKNFPRLFNGGKASLALTESDDVLDAGVEIMAQPPGKKLQSVTLLSGGEKTMTALALLVSLFQVHPSPFFLLDEVDAALDDANVGRFNEIVREMADGSQFLVITHNKSTIEIADVLYGVTMEDRGVSKVVSVQLRDA